MTFGSVFSRTFSPTFQPHSQAAAGGGTTEVKFSGVDDAPNVIVATVDANGNRSEVVLTV